jgi:hypothetical protein
MGSFSFTTEIKEDRILQLPAGSPDVTPQLRRHTLQQLEHYANTDWVISDLVCLECLVGPLLY